MLVSSLDKKRPSVLFQIHHFFKTAPHDITSIIPALLDDRRSMSAPLPMLGIGAGTMLNYYWWSGLRSSLSKPPEACQRIQSSHCLGGTGRAS